jgi:hypothetical protein
VLQLVASDPHEFQLVPLTHGGSVQHEMQHGFAAAAFRARKLSPPSQRANMTSRGPSYPDLLFGLTIEPSAVPFREGVAEQDAGKAEERRGAAEPSRDRADANSLSDTASVLAQSHYDEPYWPPLHVLAWIRFRTPAFLNVCYDEIRSLQFRALSYKTSAWPSPLISENPADILRKRLKADKIEAIRPDGSKAEAVTWYRVGHDPSTWPEVLFLRRDVLREWPELGIGAATPSTEVQTSEAHASHFLRKRRAVDAAINTMGVDALMKMSQKVREPQIKELAELKLGGLTVSERYVRMRLRNAGRS